MIWSSSWLLLIILLYFELQCWTTVSYLFSNFYCTPEIFTWLVMTLLRTYYYYVIFLHMFDSMDLKTFLLLLFIIVIFIIILERKTPYHFSVTSIILLFLISMKYHAQKHIQTVVYWIASTQNAIWVFPS